MTSLLQSRAHSALTALLVSRDNEADEPRPVCDTTNGYNGLMGVRISAIFVILAAGSFGALFPIFSAHSARHARTRSPSSQRRFSFRMPPTAFFVAKYFGSGVIVATSLIHLLQPANEALTNPCLSAAWEDYPYAFGIALVSLFTTFFVEIVSRRYLAKRGIFHSHGPSGLTNDATSSSDDLEAATAAAAKATKPHIHKPESDATIVGSGHTHSYSINRNNSELAELADGKKPNDNVMAPKASADEQANLSKFSLSDDTSSSDNDYDLEPLAMQLGSIFLLEFGVIFHSVFVGLALAVSENVNTLYIVLVFHQMFEGLGLGTRIAAAPWPAHKRWMPWALGIAFGITAPIAIAIGLGVRETYPPGSARAIITNGIFDAISAGILLYAGLVELMGNEFLHSDEFRDASTGRIIAAYIIMCCGAGFMALLGRWV
jgi:zinc transporter 1/2/3